MNDVIDSGGRCAWDKIAAVVKELMKRAIRAPLPTFAHLK